MGESDSIAFPTDQIRRIEAELLEKEQAKESFKLEVDSAEKALSDASNSKERISTELMDFEAKAESIRQQTDAARTERAKRESEKMSLEDAISRGEANLLAQTSQLEGISGDIEKLESSKRDSEMSSSSSHSNLREMYETARSDEQECRAAVDESREKLYELEKKRDYLAARHAALGQLLESPDGSASLLQAKLRGVGDLLAESIKVQPGYEKALAAALGSLANSLTATDLDSAITAVTHLKASDSGRVELLILRTEPSNSTAADSENTTLISVLEAPLRATRLTKRIHRCQRLS